MKPKPISKQMNAVAPSGACRFGFAYQAQVKYRNHCLTTVGDENLKSTRGVK
jgi:hypothetical protein